MKKQLISFVGAFILLSAVGKAQPEKKWTILFDGNSTEKLRGYKMSTFPEQAWKVEDNALVAQTGVPNIDLVTKESYKNFELEFDWKISVAGNSGVFFHMKEDAALES